MTSIIEALKPYQTDLPLEGEARKKFETVFLGGKLASDLLTVTKSSGGWSFFRWQLYEYLMRPITDVSPLWWGDVAAFCNRLNITEYETLVDWCNKASEIFTVEAVELLAKKDEIVLPELEKVDNRPVVELLEKSGLLEPYMQWSFSDAEYRVADFNTINYLNSKCPVDKIMQWVAESEDCDDFSKAYEGWFAMRGLGNLYKGEAHIVLYDAKDQVVGAHSCILWCFKENGQWTAKFLEPQDDSWHDLGSAWVGGGIGGAVRSKIYRLFM